MKTRKYTMSRVSTISGLAVLMLLRGFLTKTHSDAGYVAHEWGTFTSVQGGDGELLEWRPLESSHLPGFVYDWQHPGLDRIGAAGLLFGKAGMVTLQRMETPVIYFYADRKQKVDVSVRFPKGRITEWYPQAACIGPSLRKPSPVLAKMDTLANKLGAGPGFSFASWLNTGATKDSGARWSHVEILPATAGKGAALLLPLDRSGSHYFTARQTDANCLQVESFCTTNSAPEREKFIFYRGVGNFATPLRVKVVGDGAVTLENTGGEPLEHLFVLSVASQKGQMVYVRGLCPGGRFAVRLGSMTNAPSLAEISARLEKQMAESLVKEGLYVREAEAMVKTWKDSWFEQDGLRVLYVLPRRWTDQTLPLAMAPLPRELARVMVGRAEVLPPSLEHRLTEEVRRTMGGDALARGQLVADLRKLGRFADPALRLALTRADTASRQMAWGLYQADGRTAVNAF